jgi:hypothetical protein
MVLAGNAFAELRGIYSLYSPNQTFTKTPDLDKETVGSLNFQPERVITGLCSRRP